MAIFHLHAQMIKRSTGRSSVAAAAYRAGEKLRNDYDGVTHDYTRKSGVIYKEIMLPENAPKEYFDRSTLWNAVEKAEKRKDAQTAREMDIALPVELSGREHISLVREYIQNNFIDKGMCADFAIHDKHDGNPHAHIMLTTREVSRVGFGQKNRDWNKTELLEQWRENWAGICNEWLQSKGIDERIDHRTLEAQGITREPTIHVGAAAKAMLPPGRDSDRIREYRAIIAQNRAKSPTPEITAGYIYDIKQGYVILDREVSEIKYQSAEAYREMRSLQFRVEKITERADNIQDLGRRLDELRAERQAKGLFENKKWIDGQIGHLERSQEMARTNFKREYYVFPEEAAAEVKRLEYKTRDLAYIQERLQDRLAPLNTEKDVFMIEYQRQMLLAGISPNGQAIYGQLAQLNKTAIQEESTQGKLARIQSERVLNLVTGRSFQRILDEVSPEQAYRLIKEREREMARDYGRIRERNKNRYR